MGVWGKGRGKALFKGLPSSLPPAAGGIVLLHQPRQKCDEAGEEHQNRHT